MMKNKNCNKRRTTQGGGVAAPVGGKVFSEILPYLEVSQGNQDEVEVVEEVEVPNITGLSIKEAEKILKDAGFLLNEFNNLCCVCYFIHFIFVYLNYLL